MAALKSMFHEGAPYAFVSYSHRDEIVLKTLEQIQQVYNIWWDGEMLAGDRWDSKEQCLQLRAATAFLLFTATAISTVFFAVTRSKPH